MTPTTSPRAHRALATRIFDPRPRHDTTRPPRTRDSSFRPATRLPSTYEAKAIGIRTHDLLPKVFVIRPHDLPSNTHHYYGRTSAKVTTSFCHETLAGYSHLPRHDHARFFRAFFNEIFLGQYYWLEHGDFTFLPYGVRNQDIYCRYVSNSVILIFLVNFAPNFF